MPYLEFPGGRVSARVGYSLEQDIPGNRTILRITSVEVRSEWGEIGSCWLVGSVTVAGTEAATLILNNVAGCGIWLSGSWDGGSGWSGWSSSPVVLNHAPDGSRAEAAVKADLSVYSTSGGSRGGVAGTVRLALPNIPRASGLSTASGSLGETVQIEILPVTPGVTDTLEWVCGSRSGHLGTNLTGTVSWIPPLDLAEQAPDGDAVEVLLTNTSYLNDQLLGTGSVLLRCSIPQTVQPSLTVTVTEEQGHREKYGGFVSGRTRIRVVTRAEGSYGSLVTEAAVRLGSLSARGFEVSFLSPESGEIPLAVTVTDTRGRKAVYEGTVSILPYAEPSVTILDLYRCNAQGDRQPDGSFGAVVFSGSITGLGGGNGAAWSLCYRPRGGSAWTEKRISGLNGVFSTTQQRAVFAADTDLGYDCRIRAADDFSSRETEMAALSAAFAMLDFCREQRAVGIGQRAGTADAVSIGLEMVLNGHRLRDLAAPVEPGDGVNLELLRQLWPVGAVCLSADRDVCPAAALGGSWELRDFPAGGLFAWVRTA